MQCKSLNGANEKLQTTDGGNNNKWQHCCNNSVHVDNPQATWDNNRNWDEHKSNEMWPQYNQWGKLQCRSCREAAEIKMCCPPISKRRFLRSPQETRLSALRRYLSSPAIKTYLTSTYSSRMAGAKWAIDALTRCHRGCFLFLFVVIALSATALSGGPKPQGLGR